MVENRMEKPNKADDWLVIIKIRNGRYLIVRDGLDVVAVFSQG